MKKILILSLFTLSSSLLTLCEAQYTNLLNFSGTKGEYPNGSLLLSGNVLYGMTLEGGTKGDGCVFSINTDGSGYTDLLNFDGTNGEYPYGSLALSGSVLYGMTYEGGKNNEGCIFYVDTIGAGYKDLWDFDDTGTNGEYPNGSLTISGTVLYGMAYEGGKNNLGCIFSINTNGSGYKALWNFNDTGKAGNANGAYPEGSLTLSGGILYGMTAKGGASGDGVIFSISTSGKGYKDLLDFNNANGNSPNGDLMLSGGTLYGMTVEGGAHSDGCIFSIKTDGTGYKDLLDFNGSNGGNTYGSLTLSGSLLYGMAYAGGAHSYGNLFSLNTNGAGYIDLLDFNGTTGQQPVGNLIFSEDLLYGMTPLGGASSDGLIFSIPALGVSASAIANESCNGDSIGAATVRADGGTVPYTYSWVNADTTVVSTSDSTGTVLSAGKYTVTVADTNGYTATASVTITQPAAVKSTQYSLADKVKCNGVAAVTVSGGTSPYTYLWTTGRQNLDTIKAQCAGTYCCTVTDNNGCSLSTCVTVKSETGVENISGALSINIYPDPNNGNFTVQSSVVSGQWSVEIYNAPGEKIYSRFSTLNAPLSIDISDKANGIYLLRIQNKDGSVVMQKKIVKTQ